MGKTWDLFITIRDTKGIFHEKIGTKKDRYGMELTEAEDIKKRQEHTKVLHNKKVLMTWTTTMGVVTHLELNILEY